MGDGVNMPEMDERKEVGKRLDAKHEIELGE